MQRAVADVDLLALEHRRDRHDQRELLELALVVVGHGEHGAVAVAHQHHLRGLVEQLGVGLGDVEAAEGERRSRHQEEQGERGWAGCGSERLMAVSPRAAARTVER